ncbi:MAG: hypothetical protein BGP04_13445 [Rhizobiales bacterium 62-17]|nr:DUF58 domain-containing protein [Hyphomicrobiales bacterium]OJY02300.1 MAG: hypothetical protein BGP04_13445 [Rhizobiales bacterium 62-17]
MVDARLLDKQESALGATHSHDALSLARRLPSLVVAAKQVAATVMHGVHGRRRAGIGETFWQFRPFVWGESTTRIDWRRSARDDRIYVREREWEAAHTVWIWIDRSPSMAYVSTLAAQSKIDRAVVLGLAAADLLVRGGERVGIPGLMRPVAARNVVDRFAEVLIEEEKRASFVPTELPPREALAPRSQAIVISDMLSDPAEIETTIHGMAARGATGHVVMIADPVEETFPFAGHVEFLDVDSSARLRVGEAQSFKADYVARLAAHRDRVRAICTSRGWSFAIHRTDVPASQALLALRLCVEAAQGGA